MIQKRLVAAGLSKQAGKGAAATSPATFLLPVLGGSVLQVHIEQEAEAIAYSKRISPDENRLGVMGGAALRVRAYPRSIPAFLYGALGALATSGPVGGNYTHIATPADDLPYWTLFARMAAEYGLVPDCKIDQLTLSWSQRAPLEVEAVLLGRGPVLGAAAWSGTNEELGQPRFRGPGGTFKIDAASGVPVEAAVVGGRITIANNLAGIPLSKDVVPDDLFPGEQVIDVAFTLQPSDFAEWRKIVTGTAGGVGASSAPIYGSFEDTLVIDADTSLKFEGLRTAFLADFPEADPAGGAAEIELVGRVKQPVAGNAFTATALNQFVSY